MHKKNTSAKATRARPPKAPPTMAPMFVRESFSLVSSMVCDTEGAELVPVIVTIRPEDSVDARVLELNKDSSSSLSYLRESQI